MLDLMEQPVDFMHNLRYWRKVRSTRPQNLIAYWPLWEQAGGVAFDRSGNGRTGAYTGVTLGQPGIGDGRTSGLYDGTNDFTNIFNASLQAAFDGAEGTLMVWSQVFNAGVWTDGVNRRVLNLRSDGANRMFIELPIANGQINVTRLAGGVNRTRSIVGLSTTGWTNIIMTYSEAVDQMIVYLDGIQQGAILVGLGVWAGVIVANNVAIGATDTGPGNPYSGRIAHSAIWDAALSPAAALRLGRPV